jgi:hypothetical protein
MFQLMRRVTLFVMMELAFVRIIVWIIQLDLGR